LQKYQKLATYVNLWLVVLITLGLALIPALHTSAHADASFKAMGDVGCKIAAYLNLRNLALTSSLFFGVGDYSYGCNPNSEPLKTLWNRVPSKKGVMGNHECVKGQQAGWAATTFGNGGCSKGYGAFVKGNSVAVILLNPYTSYTEGSSQYKFVLDHLKTYSSMGNIVRIVFVFHEIMYPVPCSGPHCHGVEKDSFRSTYDPLIRQYNVFVIQAHTHLTAFGTIKNVQVATCGGGGEDGTLLNGLGLYKYVSNKMGYCNFNIGKDKVVAQHIGTDNRVLQTHTYNIS
jgi:hypothetical protein